LSDEIYYIFILDGYGLVDDSLRGTLTNVVEKSRVDINGQSILPMDYILENHNGNSVFLKFIRANFPYIIDGTDDIRVTGMFKHIPH